MVPERIDEDDVRRLAQLAGLDLNPAHVPGLIANFRVIAAIAASVNEFPLTDDIENSAVYSPCSTQEPE